MIPIPSRLWSLAPLLVGTLVLSWITLLALDHPLWTRLGWTLESSQWPVYSDLQVVLDGARLHAEGLVDPLAAPIEGRETLFNYPRAWLLLGALGIHHLPLTALGAALGVTWLFLLVLLGDYRRPGLACFLCILLLTSPVLLILERGNNDLLIASFLLVGATLLASPRAALKPLAVALFTLVGMLKLYPAAALGLAIFDLGRMRRLLPWFVGGLVFAAYCLFTLQDLALISAKTPRAITSSFGSAVLPFRFSHYLKAAVGGPISPGALFATASAAYALVFAISARVGWSLGLSFIPLLAERRTVAHYATMSAVFAGAFALGNNFAYRLIFVLPCVPLLWSAITRPSLELPLRQWSALSLGTLVVTFLFPLHSGGRTFVVSQLAIWLLVACLTAGFFALLRASRITPATRVA